MIIPLAIAFLLGIAVGLLVRYLKDQADAILPGSPDDWWI